MRMGVSRDNMSLLPSTDDLTVEQKGEIKVFGIDENETRMCLKPFHRIRLGVF